MSGYSELALEDEDGVIERRFSGDAQILGPSWVRLPSLTLGHLGVSVLWSLEMSSASPYLVSLGLPKSSMAAVLLAGPLSGLIVQPLIGILTDNSKSRFGRRRPFIVAGVALCCCATLLLGFARPVASIFVSLGSSSNDTLTICFAVLAIYCIDFSVNIVQVLDRVLIVDTLHTSQQPDGNAWAARMSIMGGIAGFFVGNLDLPSMLPILGSTQLEVLSVITCILLLGTHVWVVMSVQECVLKASSGPARTLRQEFMQLLHTFRHLPRVIRQIFAISFFSSLAGFPMMFYSSLYIAELYKNSLDIDVSSADPSIIVAIDAETTRLASRALLYSVLISLVMNLMMPALVIRQDDREDVCSGNVSKSWYGRWAGQEWCISMRRRLRCMHLATLWAIGHAVFATCLASTMFITSVEGATFMIGVTGFASAIGHWVPWTLLGEAIRSYTYPSAGFGEVELSPQSMMGVDNAERRRLVDNLRNDVQEHASFSPNCDQDGEAGERSTQLNDSDYDESSDGSWFGAPGYTRQNVSRSLSFHMHEQVSDSVDIPDSLRRRQAGIGLTAQAGSIMGVHNIFIVIPQFMVSGIASLIFMILDPAVHTQEKTVGTSHPNAVAVIFQLGAVAAVIACVLSYRLSRELRHN
ncbi:hypothetical protein V8B97DRAFT_1970583 [Scleroderma yunnanense]